MNWFLLFLISIPVGIVARILTPILPLFAIGKDHLPKWLSWFDTTDNYINGDIGYVMLHAPFPGDQTGWRRYINRVVWLWRNSAYGFSWSVLGATINETPTVVSGDIWVGDNAAESIGRKTGLSGTVKIKCGKYWEYYRVSQWGNSGKCSRIRMGWKLSGYIQDPKNYPLGSKAQFVFSARPFGGFAI